MAYTFRDVRAQTRAPHAVLRNARNASNLPHQGWKAVARHGALLGKGHYMDDYWELYHIEEDRSERHDLAAQYPDKVKELVATWFAVAGRHSGFPLDDRTALEILTSERPSGSAELDVYTYYPGTAPVPGGGPGPDSTTAPIPSSPSWTLLRRNGRSSVGCRVSIRGTQPLYQGRTSPLRL